MKTDLQKLVDRIPIRYRKTVGRIVNIVDAQATSRGMATAQRNIESSRPKEVMRDSIAMTIQRLGDANAQIATQLARILEKV